jgi:anti-sigma factor RsiW
MNDETTHDTNPNAAGPGGHDPHTRFRADLVAFLSGDLDDRAAVGMRDHLAACPACSRELESLRSVWQSLGRIPDEIPSPRLAERFQEMLDSAERLETYRGRAAAAPSAGRADRPGLIDRLGWLIPRHPAVQFALVLAVLLVGGFIGYGLRENGAKVDEMAQLREEVRSVSRLLIVSLLQQQTATERLQGVSWTYKVQDNDPEITVALLQTLNQDPNVNVRLAALDALSRNLDDPGVRGGLVKSLEKQSSPLIQLAIVDVVVKSDIRESGDALRQILRQPGVDKTVKQRIEDALQQFTT